MKNRERLQSLSDEELASFIDNMVSCDVCIHSSDHECGMDCVKNICCSYFVPLLLGVL